MTKRGWPGYFLSIDQLSAEQREELFVLTDKIYTMEKGKGYHSDVLAGKQIALVFLEPSTRTFLSFQSAIQRLGGLTITREGTSLSKGETPEDTVRIISSYADAIILRHPGGDSTKFVDLCGGVPLINGGDDANEHPSQALIDLYTIRRLVGRLDGLTVGVGFDPLHSRSIHSLCYALSKYPNNRVVFVGPEQLQPSGEQLKEYMDRDLIIEQSANLDALLGCEIVYVNRFQAERWDDRDGLTPYLEGFKSKYRLTHDNVERSMVRHILNPLPGSGD